MYGKLHEEQIDEILRAESIGRIGCQIEGKVHIIPTNFVYDGEYIHASSLEGSKLHIMRANPHVCFQVDQIRDGAHWRSVLAWGSFEELSGADAARTARLLAERLVSTIASGKPLHAMTVATTTQTQSSILVYRIHITEKTGRFEYN